MQIDLKSAPGPRSYYESLVVEQNIAVVPDFELESGQHLVNAPVAYKTWGRLNEDGDNVLVLCHALTGSSDAEDWWRPLMGPGKAFDYNRFFICCLNMLGSPYGSASPLTVNPATAAPYGPDFPETTIRDDVRIHKLVLDALKVKSIAAVIGGSLGGMATLEWPLCTMEGYVKNIIPITTSSYQSAWGISWNEAQREVIMTDPDFHHGRYIPEPLQQPARGLGAARMVGMLTYRSAPSFEDRFHRKETAGGARSSGPTTETGLPTPSPSDAGSHVLCDQDRAVEHHSQNSELKVQIDRATSQRVSKYSAQSYMQYQAEKFVRRFDANCYISMMAKMDTHDVTRDRLDSNMSHNVMGPVKEEVKTVLGTVPAHALVISVESDVLFTNRHQLELAECLPQATFVNLDSDDGHDGFLLEFEALSALVTRHLRQRLPWLYEVETIVDESAHLESKETIRSIFGEAEPDF